MLNRRHLVILKKVTLFYMKRDPQRYGRNMPEHESSPGRAAIPSIRDTIRSLERDPKSPHDKRPNDDDGAAHAYGARGLEWQRLDKESTRSLLADEDLPLHSFKSITLFMRRRSAWLCTAGALLAYLAFLPPLPVLLDAQDGMCLGVAHCGKQEGTRTRQSPPA